MDSKLQIISGMHRGRKLALPRGARPTQNRARIALFNMLMSIADTAPGVVWDAFAGSGAFGLECLSRFPDCRVVLTDVAPDSIQAVRQNLASLNAGPRATVVQTDAIGAASRFGADADWIFIDAPYAHAELGRSLVARLGREMRPGGIIIWEQEVGHEFVPDENAWEILRDKRYGRARFLILQRRA